MIYIYIEMLIILCIFYITCCYSAQKSKSFLHMLFILIFLSSKTNTVDVMKTRLTRDSIKYMKMNELRYLMGSHNLDCLFKIL